MGAFMGSWVICQFDHCVHYPINAPRMKFNPYIYILKYKPSQENLPHWAELELMRNGSFISQSLHKHTFFKTFGWRKKGIDLQNNRVLIRICTNIAHYWRSLIIRNFPRLGTSPVRVEVLTRRHQLT